MKYQFIYIVQIEIFFTGEEIECLDKWIRQGENKHEADLGGKWYGGYNSYKFHISDQSSQRDEDYYFSFTFREADRILLKSLEMSFYTSDKIAQGLFHKIHNVLSEANEAYLKVNPKQEPIEL